MGDHEVIYAGTDEVIEFKHTAYSPGGLRKRRGGSRQVPCGEPAGRYDMADVIEASRKKHGELHSRRSL